MMSKLYVGNLPVDITKDELVTLFSLAGTVTDVKIIPSENPRQKKNIAIITFSSRNGTLKAIHMLRGAKYRNRTLKLSEDLPQQNRNPETLSPGGRSIISLVGLPGGLTGDSTTDAPPPGPEEKKRETKKHE